MSASIPRPKKLGRYEIVETLASGDSGQVYKGVDPESRRAVTLRTFAKDRLQADGASALAELQSEARAIAVGLNHPGIIKVYELGEDDNLVFIAMEYVQGTALTESVRVPLADAVSLCVQLLDALDYAHDQGVLHRDVRPSNLILTENGQLRIAGFGAARFEANVPEYMSPEQFVGMPVDRRSDIFSAGVVFYELLAGVNPFAGTPDGLLDRVCNEKERPPSVVNPSVPASFDAVCAKALAKAVYERYPTALAFANSIRSAFGAPVSSLVSKEAIAAITGIVESRRDSGIRSAPPSSAGRTPFKWDQEVLINVQRQLATFVGPMAKVIVREAAYRTTDLNRLYSLVAESLQDPEERKKFLAQRSQVEPSLPPRPSSGARPAVGAGGGSSSKQPVAIPPAPPAPGKPVPPPVPRAEVKPPPPKSDSRRPAKSKAEEYVAKQPATLAGYFRSSGPQLEEVIHPFISTVQAVVDMYAANKKGAALSPENILFDRMGKASIQPLQTPAATGSGIVLALPRYAAPEIFAEKGTAVQSSGAAHVYALGLMFYEILAGRDLIAKVFPDQQSDLDWLRWHGDLESKAPALKNLLPSCPDAMSDLLEEMMEKNAEKRIQDPQTVLSRLRAVAQRAHRTVILDLKKPATPPAPAKPQVAPRVKPAQPRKDGTGVVIWLLILAVAGLLGILVWKNQDRIRELIEPYLHRSANFSQTRAA